MIIKLSTGKEIHANHGIIGLTPENYKVDGCRITTGYDAPEFLVSYSDSSDGEPTYTKEELIEICDIMIERWSIFKNRVKYVSIDNI